MRVAIARTMPNFSMDVYADGITGGLKAVRPAWEIQPIAPQPADRRSRSVLVRAKKSYERFWNFPRQVSLQSADLFHIIDQSEAHIVRWLKQTGKPVLVTCHDLINYYYQQNLQGSVKLPFVSSGLWKYSIQSMQYADRIVAVSQATAQDITRILGIPSKKIVVVPNAVDRAFHRLPAPEVAAFRQARNLPENTFCLLNVGSNHPRKNIETILKAVALLKQQGVSVQFWKAGAEFTQEQQQMITAGNIEDCAVYIGNPDQATLIQIYNAADVLIAPSYHEGFGLTLLEAMACGTPVITADVSAMPEVVGNAGILVSPDDVGAIAERVVQLQQNSTYRQELIERSLLRVKTFTWENNAEQLATLYESLCGLQTSALDSIAPQFQPSPVRE